jgi:peroxiredoxin
MRILWLVTAVISTAAWAQTPQELLRLAQETYNDRGGYEIEGTGSVRPAGSSWTVTFSITIVAAPAPLETLVRTAVKLGGPLEFSKTGEGSDGEPEAIGFPLIVTGAWEKIAENVASVTETGTERLLLNGELVDCRELEVKYGAAAEETRLEPVTYSICSEKHMVLKKVMRYSTSRRDTDPAGEWTITLDRAHFRRPAPDWLRETEKSFQAGSRSEWQGKDAPAFSLDDLEGNPVEFSALHGKVVLLDFWSITCAPCVRELPMLEKLAARHKDDLVVWGISENPPQRDTKWLAQHAQSFPTLSDPEYAVSSLFRIQGVPTTILIGRDGKIRNYWLGEVDPQVLETAVTAAISPTKPAEENAERQEN